MGRLCHGPPLMSKSRAIIQQKLKVLQVNGIDIVLGTDALECLGPVSRVFAQLAYQALQLTFL